MTDKKAHGLAAMLREYLTHWTVAGSIVTLTGFAPDHLVAHALHAIPEGLQRAFPEGIDYRVVIVAIGVMMIAGDVLLRRRRGTPSDFSGVQVMAEPRSHEVPSAPSGNDLPRHSTGSQSIAVLPFENLSNDPEQAYFAEGLTASLTTDLSRVPGLFVIASTSMATLEGTAIDLRQLGRDLGVRYLLRGSVQRGDDRMRINAQLIEAETSAQVWSERFDAMQADLLLLQDQITARIANALGREIVSRVATDLEKRGGGSQSIEYWLRGIAAEGKQRTLQRLVDQEALFKKAVNLDPENADAWARLARVQINQALNFGSALSAGQAESKLAEGRSSVEKALTLDPNNPRAHHAEGLLNRALGRNADAVQSFKTAIQLDSNHASAYTPLGSALIHLGRPNEAIDFIERGMALDPLNPGISVAYANLGRAHFLAQRSDLAIAAFSQALKLNASLPRPRADLAAVYAQKGDIQAAHAIAETLLREQPNLRCGHGYRKPDASSTEEYRKLYDEVILPAYIKAGIPE